MNKVHLLLIAAFAAGIHYIILQIASVHGLAQQPEAFYHSLMLVLILYLELPLYQLLSNRESGYGCYDIAIIPQDTRQLRIILALKRVIHKPKASHAVLVKAAQDALKQIHEQAYMSELKALRFQKIAKIALAFSDKNLHVEYAIENLKPKH